MTSLVLQRKRDHGRRARLIVSCTCDGERTNHDNESSDNGMIFVMGLPLSVVDPFRCITAVPCLRCDRCHKLLDF
jgi:hypothetical protein